MAAVVLFLWSAKAVTEFRWTHLGIVLMSAGILLAIGLLYTYLWARTSPYLTPFSICIAVGFCVVSVEYLMTGQTLINFVMALLQGLMWLGYLFWYSKLPMVGLNQLQIGKKIPFFEVKGLDGRFVSSWDMIKKPSLVLFFRGNWCPLCMAQIIELAALYKEIEEQGVEVFLISAQTNEASMRLSMRFKVNFVFLIDEGGKVAENLGILLKNALPMGLQLFGHKSHAALPVLIALDAKGTIVAIHQTDNYRLRPEPAHFLRLLAHHDLLSPRI